VGGAWGEVVVHEEDEGELIDTHAVTVDLSHTVPKVVPKLVVHGI
jgi:hypothetical protein